MLLKILRILKLEQTIDYIYKQNKTNEPDEIISIFDVVQSPPLSSPLWIWKNLGHWKFRLTINFVLKNYDLVITLN